MKFLPHEISKKINAKLPEIAAISFGATLITAELIAAQALLSNKKSIGTAAILHGAVGTAAALLILPALGQFRGYKDFSDNIMEQYKFWEIVKKNEAEGTL